MVEFRFDIRPLFQNPIVKVTSNLLPHTFRGDRRQALDATSKMSEIIDRLGLLSAAAQKLTKPVTTAQKLRMSENQIVYLLADVDEGHNGSVVGLLKVGTKDLYLFDETGETQKIVNAPCILDFYVHESRQRAGLGKDLFETMLADEQWTPIKCSIDRPSEKLLGFMKKHYGLEKAIPQANNFVLYEGFFDAINPKSKQATNGLHITNSEAIQQPRHDAVEAITEDLEKLHTAMEQLEEDVQSVLSEAGSAENLINENDNADNDALSSVDEITEEAKVEISNNLGVSHAPSVTESISSVKKTTTFHLSKQHTGMKNRSFGVGMAVTPTNKMEFDQEDREDFGVVKINRPIGKITSPTADNTDAMSTVSSSGEGITDQGYHDLKFYHNKLW